MLRRDDEPISSPRIRKINNILRCDEANACLGVMISPTTAGQTKGLLMTDSVDIRLYPAYASLIYSFLSHAVSTKWSEYTTPWRPLVSCYRRGQLVVALQHYDSTWHTSSGNKLKVVYRSKLKLWTQPSTSQSHVGTTALPRVASRTGYRPGARRGTLTSASWGGIETPVSYVQSPSHSPRLTHIAALP